MIAEKRWNTTKRQEVKNQVVNLFLSKARNDGLGDFFYKNRVDPEKSILFGQVNSVSFDPDECKLTVEFRTGNIGTKVFQLPKNFGVQMFDNDQFQVLEIWDHDNYYKLSEDWDKFCNLESAWEEGDSFQKWYNKKSFLGIH